MNAERLVWTIILIVAGVWIAYRASTGQMGQSYVAERDGEVVYANPTDFDAQYSFPRTIGLWASAIFTLAIFSFLYRDNPLYRFSEAIVVGVSAAYWMVVNFWQVLVPNLMGFIAPNVIRDWAMPGLEQEANYFYLIPMVFGLFLLMRLSPKGAWLSRWALALIIGTTAGIRLTGFLHTDFLSQINSTIEPLVVPGADGGYNFWTSLKNITIFVGVLACLVYFFFSWEHKGLVGRTARVGMWFLMITFGAGFGYTVMGRIALLASRLEYLLDDWLWLIDLEQRRTLAAAFLSWWS